jgi:hypothetical protein
MSSISIRGDAHLEDLYTILEVSRAADMIADYDYVPKGSRPISMVPISRSSSRTSPASETCCVSLPLDSLNKLGYRLKLTCCNCPAGSKLNPNFQVTLQSFVDSVEDKDDLKNEEIVAFEKILTQLAVVSPASPPPPIPSAAPVVPAAPEPHRRPKLILH